MNSIFDLEEISEASIINGEGSVADVQTEVEDTSSGTTIHVVIDSEGPKGPRGFSTYELWLQEGNVGTVDDFLRSLSYTHPPAHTPDIIVETEQKQFISLSERLRISGYIHDQIASAQVWVVNHTLDKFPSVSVVDTGDNLVVGEVEYNSKAQLTITFSAEFSGKAYLN